MKIILFGLFTAIVMGCSFGNKPSQETASTVDSIPPDKPIDSSHLEIASEKNRLPDFDNSTHSLDDDGRAKILSKSLYNLTDWMVVPDTNTAIKMGLITAALPWGNMGEEPLEAKMVNVGELSEGVGATWWAFTLTFEFDRDLGVNAKNVFTTVSGIQYTMNEDEQPFKHLNPELVKWAFANLYLPPGRELQGVKLQTLYNNSFRKFVRTLATSHQVLGTNLHDEADWYNEAIIGAGNDVREFYARRYTVPDPYSDQVNPDYYPKACTFWVRRSIDGTEDLLWTYMRRMIKDYDREWGCKKLQLCD